MASGKVPVAIEFLSPRRGHTFSIVTISALEIPSEGTLQILNRISPSLSEPVQFPQATLTPRLQNTFRSPTSSPATSRRAGKVLGKWALIPWISEGKVHVALRRGTKTPLPRHYTAWFWGSGLTPKIHRQKWIAWTSFINSSRLPGATRCIPSLSLGFTAEGPESWI